VTSVVSPIEIIPNSSLEKVKHASATSALYVNNLPWWTTDEQIVKIVEKALGECFEQKFKKIIFNELKVNGKSRG
jgi:hypothetical protein